MVRESVCFITDINRFIRDIDRFLNPDQLRDVCFYVTNRHEESIEETCLLFRRVERFSYTRGFILSVTFTESVRHLFLGGFSLNSNFHSFGSEKYFRSDSKVLRSNQFKN